MKYLITIAVILMSAVGINRAGAQTFTADDFCGEDKFCTQTFYASEMLGTDLIQESCWSRFEKIDDTHIRLVSFKNGGAVKFTIDGDKLIVDDSEKGNGSKTFSKAQETTNSNGDKVKVETVTHHTYVKKTGSDKGKTFHHFKVASTPFYGLISNDENGTTSVNLSVPGYYLQLRRRETGGDTGNSTWDDWYNSFSRIDFKIYDSNGFTEDSSPINVFEEDVDKTSSLLNIKNILKRGESIRYLSTSSSNLENDGSMNGVIYLDGSFSLNPYYACSISASYKKNNLINDGTYGYYVTSIKPTNTYLTGIDGGDIHGTYTTTYHFEPGWDAWSGGEFRTFRRHTGTTQWKTYDEDVTSGAISNEQTFSGELFNYDVEMTPEVYVEDAQFHYNEDGVRFLGSLREGATNSQFVNSYDVFAVIGDYHSVSEGNFDASLENGHSEAIFITEEAQLPHGGELTFDKFMSRSDLEAKGWDPTKNVTIYVRLNLRDDLQRKQAPARELRATPVNYSFGAMKSVAPQMFTGITGIGAEAQTIIAGKGVISVTGNGNIAVYDVSGRTIYTGKAGDIAVVPGMYIVKTATTSCKLLIK